MTKRFGALVGAVKQLSPTRLVDMAWENTTDHVLVKDYITLAAAAIADTVQFGIFGWETILSPGGIIYFDALGAGVTLSLGDAGHTTALINAKVCTSAGNVNISANLTLDLYHAPLWQQLGYATLAAAQAVAPNCELLLTIGVGAATGKVAWTVGGQKRI